MPTDRLRVGWPFPFLDLTEDADMNSTCQNELGRAAQMMIFGQLSLIAATLLHAGGDANDHHAIFMAYARDAQWIAVHLAQFLAMYLLLAGLARLFHGLRGEAGIPGVAARLGGPATTVALALYGALQAVDGVALKHAVSAWTAAPVAEGAARFASAEVIRWLEWGLRSYHDLATAITLLLASVALWRLSRSLVIMACAAGLAYLAQSWFAATIGFTHEQSIGIVLGWVLGLAWMIGLAAVTRRQIEGQVSRNSSV